MSNTSPSLKSNDSIKLEKTPVSGRRQSPDKMSRHVETRSNLTLSEFHCTLGTGFQAAGNERMTAQMTKERIDPIDLSLAPGCRLWIDGVGCWLIWWSNELTFGNSSPQQSGEFRFRILSDLQTRHGTWKRREGSDWFDPWGPARLNDLPVDRETSLRGGDRISLGSSAELQLEIPSPLSQSAVVTINSSHRSGDHFDGTVLFHQTCLLGPGTQNHIVCRHWQETIVLHENDNKLWWQVHQSGNPPQQVSDGAITGTEEQLMRFEMIRVSE